MSEKTQLHELTSTRFFAAMAVFLGHFSGFLQWPDELGWMIGGFGVSFFFVLSGFILCYRYWDDFAEGVAGAGYRRYFGARIARIYPAYVLALVLMTLLYFAMNLVRPGTIGFPPDPVLSWVTNLLALQTFAPTYLTQQMWNGPSWSISTEFGFYVACPFILAAIARRRMGWKGLAALFVAVIGFAIAMQSLALYLVFKHGWDRDFWLDIVASRNIFWRIPEFLAGVIAARLMYGGHLRALADSTHRNGLLFASLAVVVLLNSAPWPTEPMQFLVMRQYRIDIAYMIPFVGIVAALASGPTLLSPLLRWPALVFLGDASYGIYIYHWIPWTIVSHAKAAGLSVPPILVTGVVVATIMFSAACFVTIERPARVYLRQKLT